VLREIGATYREIGVESEVYLEKWRDLRRSRLRRIQKRAIDRLRSPPRRIEDLAGLHFQTPTAVE